MDSLTAAMRDLIDRQRLCFVATVGADGRPRLAPQSTLAVWDEGTLVFADLASPGTGRNLLENPAIQIGVVDPLLRKGFRFEGTARLLLSGPTFDRLVEFYRARGVTGEVHHMVLVHVERAEEIVSPVYAQGWNEAAVRRRWLVFRSEQERPRRRRPR